MSNNERAFNAYINANQETVEILERLTEHFKNLDDSAPEDVNWAAAETIQHYKAKLKEVSDQIFNEGEYTS